MDWLNLLAVQIILKSLLQHHSSKTSILWCSAFFTAQLSHPNMTTGKTIALTGRTFVTNVSAFQYAVTVIQIYALTSNAEEAEVEQFYEDLQMLLELTPKNKMSCPFHRELECKNRKSRNNLSNSKFGLGVQNEARQRLIEFCQENALVLENTLFNNTRVDSTYGHHQIPNTKIRLIIFFAAKDGEALYSQQKQGWELTMAQIMNSLLTNSDLNWRKWGKNH